MCVGGVSTEQVELFQMATSPSVTLSWLIVENAITPPTKTSVCVVRGVPVVNLDVLVSLWVVHEPHELQVEDRREREELHTLFRFLQHNQWTEFQSPTLINSFIHFKTARGASPAGRALLHRICCLRLTARLRRNL